jgi:predicted nucleotidyltransferase component of viral defense system
MAVSDSAFIDLPIPVGGLPVASFRDLVVGKMLTASDRTDAKDAVDLWAAASIGKADLALLSQELGRRDHRYVTTPDRWPRTLDRLAHAMLSLELPHMLVPVDRETLATFLHGEAVRAIRAILPAHEEPS